MPGTDLPRVPERLDGITANWLSDQFRDQGVLASGQVDSIQVEPQGKWNVAETAIVTVTYDTPAGSTLPRSFFVKLNHNADPYGHVFEGEAAFYQEHRDQDLPIPRCYAVVFDPETRASCIVLENLQNSHDHPPWPLPPTGGQCHDAIATLACLHAHSWDHGTPAVRGAVEKFDTEVFSATSDGLQPLVDVLGDRLSGQRLQLLEQVIPRITDLKSQRISTGGALTRIHSDPHAGNFLFSRTAENHDCVLVDWEDWHWNLAAADLAMMMALYWYPSTRAELEENLLRTYQEALQQKEIDYRWPDLHRDYRLAHACNILVPVIQHGLGMGPEIWWPHLERWFLAFDDLACAEFL